MKVIFKVIKTGSGNDVYFERLHEALKKVKIESVIEYYPKFFQFFPWLLKLVNKKTPGDIIHSNVEYGWVFKEKEIPLYVTLHHNVFDKNYFPYTSIPQRFFYNFILRPNIKKSLEIASKIIAVSKYTRKSFIKEYGDYQITVIYNFVDTDKYKPVPIKSKDPRFKLLFVGNLIKRKGADLLPQIMKKLGPDYVLYYTSGLRTKIPKEFGLPSMIPLGKLSEDDLIKEYNKCDALLFPSRLEGFGYTVAEAMACGKPIIAIKSSSLPELVQDGINGFFTDGNIQNFVNKITSLTKRKNFSNLNVFNINKIKNIFSLIKKCNEYKKIYES